MQILKTAEILIVEDETLLRRKLSAFLEDHEASVTAAANLEEARRLLDKMPYDFALLDVNLPDGNGLDLLRKGVFSGNTAVVVMTGNNGIETAVEAMRLGAADFITKPFDLAELPLILSRTRQNRQAQRLEEFRREKEAEAPKQFLFSDGLSELKKNLEKIIAADERLQGALPPVLVEGETGTGKSSIARWLHYHGVRQSGPMVEVNCSALPESLAESELFGHDRGAFTDARKERIGLFEAANGGTLFLDEIPSLPLPLQAKVLTAIEDRKIRRLGGNKTISVDVRVIAAANVDLREAVQNGDFRADLYHRLDLYRLRLPPLRERAKDLRVLADHLLEKISQRYRLPGKTLSKKGIERLHAYAWPGNVRELEHVLERAVVFEENDQLDLAQLLPSSEASQVNTPSTDWLNPNFLFPEDGFDLEEAINHLIHRALNQTDQNVSAASRLLGVPRDYIRYRLKKESTSPDE